MYELTSTFALPHHGDCRLIGVSPDLTIFAEVIFADDQLAQYALTLDGRILQSAVENPDSASTFVPLSLPAKLTRPAPIQHTRRLNFSGPRHRGLRDPERITDVVRALEVPTRMILAQNLPLPIPPPHILGIAESHVMAEALLMPPSTYLVCRRLRIAYALPEIHYDADHQPYDYDTLVHYAAHRYNAAVDDFDVPSDVFFAGLPGVDLLRPMDCLLFNQQLFVADGGNETLPARLHVWKIRL